MRRRDTLPRATAQSAARAIGLNMPQALRLRADEVIE